MPSEESLIDKVVLNHCYVTQQGMLIAKSDLKFNYSSNRREISLRDYLISKMNQKNSIHLSEIIAETNAKYVELKPFVDELCVYKDQVCTIRHYPGSQLNSKLSEQHMKAIKKAWDQLAIEVQRHQEKEFYKNYEEQIQTQRKGNKDKVVSKGIMKGLIQKLNEYLSEAPVSNIQNIMSHLMNVKEFANTDIDNELLTHIIEDHTLSYEDKFYQKELASNEATAARNLLVRLYSENNNKTIKKPELKKQLLEQLNGYKIEIEDKILNQIITTYTESSGKALQLRRP